MGNHPIFLSFILSLRFLDQFTEEVEAEVISIFL